MANEKLDKTISDHEPEQQKLEGLLKEKESTIDQLKKEIIECKNCIVLEKAQETTKVTFTEEMHRLRSDNNDEVEILKGRIE